MKTASEVAWLNVLRAKARETPIVVLEAALVRKFLLDQNLEVKNNTLLKDLLSADKERFEGSELPFLNLDNLVKAFEVLVPPDEAKAYGAVFTPSRITSFMSAETLTAERVTAETRVLDPSCGCGALLVAALLRIHALTAEKPSRTITRLYGVDINPESIGRAKVLLALTALTLGEDAESFNFNLKAGNALTLDWDDTFGSDERFDIVLGNPPYVRYQNLPPGEREALNLKYKTLKVGSPNLYFAFFELAKERVTNDGIVSFITPNNFFMTKAASILRGWLSAEGSLAKIVDFGSRRVFDALTYSTITFLEGGAGALLYANLESGELEELDSSSFVTIPFAELGTDAWRLNGKRDVSNVKKLLTSGQALGDVAEVRYGVKTCRDRVYLVKGPADAEGMLTKNYLGASWKLEEAATVPHVVVPEVSSTQELLKDERRIIYPYRIKDGSIAVIPEEEFRDLYPQTYKYLQAVRPELENRDKGKKNYAAWYAYARTQALQAQPVKLLTPEYAAKPRFMLDSRPGALFSNGCSVTLKPGSSFSLEALATILNSGVFHYFIDKTSSAIDSGFRSYQKTRISPFGVLDLDALELKSLSELSQRDQDLRLAELYEIVLPESYLRA